MRRKMKFLTISKVTDAATLFPPAIMRQLMEASLTWLDGVKKSGKLLEFYAITDGRYVAICEEPSADDALKTLASCPTAGIMNNEVYALADGTAPIKVFIENLKQAEKLFPSGTK
jgi:hypothetical protein